MRARTLRGRGISLVAGWALVLGLCGAFAVRAAAPVRAELDGEFHEAVQEDVRVSGSVIVGVAAASALSGDATLAGLIIPTSAERICLTVLSRDGTYYSRNTFRVPGAGQVAEDTLVLLPYEGTRRRDLLRSFGSGDLAVRATPGDCEQSPSTYLVATRETSFESVDVLINSFGANAVFYRTTDGTEADCEEFTEGRRTSYDYRCTIPVAALRKGRQVVFIERERYGRPLGEVEIELRLSNGS